MKKHQWLIFAGFAVLFIGATMEFLEMELGDFISGLGTGVLITGIAQAVYAYVQHRKAQQQN